MARFEALEVRARCENAVGQAGPLSGFVAVVEGTGEGWGVHCQVEGSTAGGGFLGEAGRGNGRGIR